MTTKRKVLVADASKVVRASLAKQLAGHFEVREEASGESAWQTLVLDSAIVGVVSGVSLTKMDGLGLIERVRASKLARLKSLPFFLVVSSSFGDAERHAARQRGVTDFVSKDSSNTLLQAVLAAFPDVDHEAKPDGEVVAGGDAPVNSPLASADTDDIGLQTDVGVADILGQLGDVQGLAGTVSGNAEADESLGDENPVGAQEKLDDLLAQYLAEAKEGSGTGVLAFGIDNYDALASRYGVDLVTRTVEKFSFMIARKIGRDDLISHLPEGRVVIVARQTTSATCAAFANRICKAMATAQVAVHGQRIDLTVSAGIAVVPEDSALLSGQEVLNLAYDRLGEAQRMGGNRVISLADTRGSGLGDYQTFLPQLKALLASTDPSVLRPCLGAVGLQLMPILREMERTLRLGMPIEDMNKRLWDRARSERMG